MPSRAFHHKTRHGCTNCRQRRKKCDQQRPICRRCQIFRSQCSYSQALGDVDGSPMSTSLLVAQSGLTPWTVMDPLIQAAVSLQLPKVEVNDLELIHHYASTNSETFTSMPGLFALKQTNNIAGKVARYPYLLHGILAVSALHLQAITGNTSESKRIHYTERAFTHQQLALSSYVPILHSIDDKTCHSIFAFSVILAGLELGFVSHQGQAQYPQTDTYLNNVIHIFDLLLGAVTVANAASAWIENCRSEPLAIPLKAVMERKNRPVNSQMQDTLTALSAGIRLAHSIQIQREPESAHQDLSIIYSSVIPELWNAFCCLGMREPDKFIGTIGWPAFVDSSYVSLLKQRHPAALVVLAYYGVILHSLDHAWWLRGVGSQLIRSIAVDIVN
ncbi:hypothetical protein F5884DRAFT_110344 [Xylogone sp. PMI_703]|nr:hypothetical protein F5884DRAFT_110344 [Xylogone sp. PMI_703]